MIDHEAFENAKKKIIGIERKRYGIGTLSEKTTHAILKNYYQPDEDKQEIPIENYVADIYTGKEIIEIQTRQFDKMREKLKTFLPLYPVIIVYPIPHTKWLIWIDEETGEFSSKRKSPLKGNPYIAFEELYKIKMFLNDKNIRFKFVMMDMEEYKLLNGYGKNKKNHASRYDRIPINIVEEIEINCREDYMQFVPYNLEDEFTSKEFAKAANIHIKLAQTVLNILYHVGILTRVGKKGNQYLYAVLKY